MRFILCTWFGDFCSCCCLTALPGPAWVLLSKIYKSGSSVLLYSNRKVQEIAAEHFRIAFVTSTNDMAKWNRWGELRIAISGEGLVGRSGIVFLFVEPIAAGAFSDGAEKLTHRQISSSHLIFNAEGGSPHQLLSAQFIFLLFCNPSDK